MFSEKSLEFIQKIDEQVSKMNSKVKHPYYFSWSFPTNHRHEEQTELSYFCVNLGKYLLQETKDTVERCQPIELPYFFGNISVILDQCEVSENIADIWSA